MSQGTTLKLQDTFITSTVKNYILSFLETGIIS